ncbi:hypothetical protein H0H92_007683 [Tricholoma furcatifolium]|nr:hypothetical protein H0H92_007683 [Tricholoma furcatifolium]
MAPGPVSAPPDKRKGKEKSTSQPPKAHSRLTRQASAALELENAAANAISDDDAVNYEYSDAPNLGEIGTGIDISVLPASSSHDVNISSRPVTGTTLDTLDEEYLSPDTEDARAAAVLAGHDADPENDLAQDCATGRLDPEDATLDPALLGYGLGTSADNRVTADASAPFPTTPAVHTGRRSDRTPASGDRPSKRTRERTQQSPWNADRDGGGATSSIFPLDRAQVVAERASMTYTTREVPSNPTATQHAHTQTTNSLFDRLRPYAAPQPSDAAPSNAAAFTLTQDQLLAIIAAAQAGTLGHLAQPASVPTQAAAGTRILFPHTSRSAYTFTGPSRPSASNTHSQSQAHLLAHGIILSYLTYRMHSLVTISGNRGLAPPAPNVHRPFTMAPVHPTLGTPFAPAQAPGVPLPAPAAAPSGFTPMVRRLANPAPSALHTLPPTQSVILSADDRVTPHKVQKILRLGFREHIPLHHLTNKLMEEAAFSPPPSGGGFQISGQTISIGSVGLDTAGERNLTAESWIECSTNLVRSIAEHLLAGSDGRCGGPTAKVIAARFEQHFNCLRGKADFIAHFRLYLEYDIRMRSRWVTMSHEMDIAVWQDRVWDAIVRADMLRSSDAMITTLSNFQNGPAPGSSSSSSSRGKSSSFRDSGRDRASTSTGS